MAIETLDTATTDEQSGFKIISFTKLPDPYWPMVFSSWLRIVKHSDQFFRRIDRDAFYKVYRNIIVTLTSRPGIVFKLAVLADDYDICLGYSVSEPGVLHFIYVEALLRGQGLSKYLLPEDLKLVTHMTKLCEARILRKRPQVKFNPFYPEPQ